MHDDDYNFLTVSSVRIAIDATSNDLLLLLLFIFKIQIGASAVYTCSVYL